jgi:hypothetical protein
LFKITETKLTISYLSRVPPWSVSNIG